MRTIIAKTATTNKKRISIKTALLVPASILLAVSSVMQSDARPHNDQLRPIKPSNLVYNPDLSRRDNSCFNIPGLPDQYACSSYGG